MANQNVTSDELLDELRRIGADTAATYFVVVPASPIDTGAAATHGPLDVTEATQEAAQARLDQTLAILRSENLEAEGTLGDYRPMRALADAVQSFEPDQIVIATLPPEMSVGIGSTSSTAPAPVRSAGDARGGQPCDGGSALVRVERVDLGGVLRVDRLALELHRRRQLVAARLPVDRQDREPLDLLDA